jgi:hypothetical protein
MKHFDRLIIIWFFCTVSAFAQRNTSSTLSFGLPVLWGTQPSDGSPKAPLGLTGNVDNSTSTSFSSHFAYYKPFKNSLDLVAGLDVYMFDRSVENTSYQASGMVPSIGIVNWFGKGKISGKETRFGLGASLGAGSFRTTFKTGSTKELLSFGNENTTWGATSLPLSASATYQVPLKSGQMATMGVKYTYVAGDAGLDGYQPTVAGSMLGDHIVTASIGFAFKGKSDAAQEKKVSNEEKAKADLVAATAPVKKEEPKTTVQDTMDPRDRAIQRLESKIDSLMALSGDERAFASGTKNVRGENTIVLERMGSSSSSGVTTVNGRKLAGSSNSKDFNPSDYGNFAVVVGSFRSPNLAEKYQQTISSREGIELRIVQGSNGYFRVYTGPFTSWEDALRALNQARKHTPTAWALGFNK